MVIDGKHYVERSIAGEVLARYYIEAKARTRKIGNWKILGGGDCRSGSLPASISRCPIPTGASRWPVLSS